MDNIEAKQDEILSSIGLKRHMVWREDGNSIYDKNRFRQYDTNEYRNPKRRESDDFYGIFEFNLMHIATGIRTRYSTSESSSL